MQISRQAEKRQTQDEHSAASTANLLPAILAAAATAALQQQEQARLIALDVIEKPQQFEVRADLPGAPKEYIILQADGNILSLSVEKGKEQEVGEGVRVHRRERTSTYAPRSVRLPESCDLSHVQADVENGVLFIVIPKKSQKEKQRTIKIGSKAGS